MKTMQELQAAVEAHIAANPEKFVREVRYGSGRVVKVPVNVIEAWLDMRGFPEPPCGAYAGPGWLPLLDALFDDLLALGWNRALTQIKVKWGALCVYIGREGYDTPEHASWRARIDRAVEEADYTCWRCGVKGEKKLQPTSGPLAGCCDECKAKDEVEESKRRYDTF